MLFEKKDIVTRYAENPILTHRDMPTACRAVFNAGAATFDGRYVLVLRVESRDKSNHLWLAWSDDGIHFRPEPKPLEFVVPEAQWEEWERWDDVHYDPRVTRIGDVYYIVFAVHSVPWGCRLALAQTADFKTFTFMHFLSSTDNRNGVLFPEKIGGRYYRLERPVVPGGQGHLWLSESPDLVHWGGHRQIMAKQQLWESVKIGGGPVPIRTDEGWLIVYHAVNSIVQDIVYQLGVALLDLEDPSKVIARGRSPILWPEETYERLGEAPNVIFSNGAVVEEDGEIKLYYGACDTVLCLATTSVDRLLYACRRM